MLELRRPSTGTSHDRAALDVLLVEDNPGDVRLVQEMLLEASGGQAVENPSLAVASSLAQADEMLQARRHDLILLDLSLPDGQGLDSLQHIRQMAPEIPVVVLTVDDDEQMVLAARQAGAQDYLVKGELTARMLFRTIRFAVEQQRSLNEKRQQERFSRGILDSLSSNIAVLDADGRILDTNQAWDSFARENGVESEAVGLGVNYLDVCRRAAERGAPLAGEACAGIEAVLSGRNPSFQLEYECHSATEERWFRMVVTPLGQAGSGVVIAHEDVTERFIAERKLSQRERELRSLLENSPDVVTRYDLDGRHLYISPAIEGRTGRPPQEYIGKTDRELGVPPARERKWRRAREQVRQTGEMQSFELEHEMSGELRVYRVEMHPEYGPEGELESILSLSHDITDLRAAQRAEREQREQIRTLVDNSPDIITRYDRQGRHLYVNPAVEQIADRSPDDYVGKTNAELDIDPERAALWQREIEAVVASGNPRTFKFEVQTENGRRILETRMMPEVGASGHVKSVVAVSRDITDLVLAHEQLDLRERILESISTAANSFLASPVWEDSVMQVLEKLGQAAAADRVYITQNHEAPDGSLLNSLRYEWAREGVSSGIDSPELQDFPLVEGGFGRWLETFREDGIVHGVVDELPPREREFLAAHGVQSLVAAPISVRGELWGFMGFDRCLESTNWEPQEVEALRTAATVLGSAIERQQYVEELTQREQTYRALVEQSSDAVAILDQERKISYVSPSVRNVLGYKESELLGQLSHDLVHPEDLADVRERGQQLAQLAAGSVDRHELRLRNAAGEWRWIEMVATNMQHEPSVGGFVINFRDVTERRRAADELRQQQREFETLAENSPDVIARFDRQLRHMYVSPAVERVSGLAPEEFIGKSNRELGMDQDMVARLDKALTSVFESGEPGEVDFAFDGPDGQRRFHTRLTPEYGPDGEVATVLSVARDVTERLEVQEQLRRSEQRYRQLFELNQAAVFQSTFEGKLLEYNRAFAELFGLPVDKSGDAEYSVLDLYVDSQDREPLLLALAEHGSVNQFELRMKRTDGTPIWVLTTSSLLDREGPDPVLQGTLLDVTEQRKAQQQLAASERRFRALVQNSSDLITLLDSEGVILYQSPSISEVLGLEPADLVGHKSFDFVYEPDRKPFAELFEQLVHNPEQTISGEVRATHRDGSLRHIELRGRNLLSDPAVNAIVINARDVTGQRRRTLEQEAVVRVAAALRSAGSRAEMPPVILGELRELLHADSVALVTHNRGQDQMTIERAVGEWERMEGRRLERGEGLSWKVFESGEPLEVANLAHEGAFKDSKYLDEQHAGLGVPLIVQERVNGVLWLAREHEFAPEEVGIAAAVADMAANGLHRATLHEETQRRAEQMATVSQLGQTLGQALDQGFVYERLVEAAFQLQPDVATVLISRYHSGRSQFTLAYGVNEGELIDVSDLPPVPLEEAGMGGQSQVIHSGEAYIVNDLNVLYERRPDSRVGDPPYTQSALYLPLVSRGHPIGVLQLQSYKRNQFSQADAEVMTLVANTAAVALTNAEMLHEIQTSNVQLSLAYDSTLEGWAKALELRDQETEGHTRRVTDMTVRLALDIGISPDDLIDVRRGAMLHDIGKMGIPDNILLKPGSLTDEEWEIMRQHPVYARDMLADVDYVARALDIPYYHHERWDGSGYPESLKGEEIPLAARIFAVVDVYDALCSDRPYRDAWPEQKAVDYLRDNAGVLFDPDIVAAFLRMLEA